MARVLKRPAASRDIIALWVWYAENAPPELADRFMSETESALQTLATQPKSGWPVRFAHAVTSELRAARVSSSFRKILLVYCPLTDGIELIRVVHGNRELSQLAEDKFFQ
ncbi:MAG: type II toxin-antitoxin system RelE/ParE family toxin [Bryobacterales bacterium]|nr:type II toxin-antitoxin system RelE/ParE family toxin [Bryobacterales bacterium]